MDLEPDQGMIDLARPDRPTDTALVAAVRAGQVEAFAELVRRFQHDVVRIISALLYDRSRTEDLVQQVFVNAYRGLNTFATGRDVGPWLRTIARNTVREHLRRSARYRQRLADYGDLLAAESAADAWSAERVERLQRLLDVCLQRLPERSAQALRMHYVEDRDTATVAAELGTSPGAVRNLLCRLRVSLRQCIDRESAKQ
jgi:RNA polymerase sigma-70 factor (ECF subfamily)